MGFLLLFTITPIVLLILGLVFLKEKYWLVLLLMFVIPIMGVSANIYTEAKYSLFKKKYEFISIIDFESLKNIESKIEYLETVKWINEEINNSKKNYDSFWYGLFTDKRLTEYQLINTVDYRNQNN